MLVEYMRGDQNPGYSAYNSTTRFILFMNCEDYFMSNLSNEKRAGCLGYMLGMKFLAQSYRGCNKP